MDRGNMNEFVTKESQIERANEILADLVEYTGKPRDLVKERCKSAFAELAWIWHNQKHSTAEEILQFYKTTDLYIFDLTKYQSLLVLDVNMMIEELKERKLVKMLDLGGGIGEYTIRAIQEAGCDVTFLELKDSKTLEYAKWRFTKHKVKPKIVTESYPWQDEEWDVVFAMDVIEHMTEAEAKKTLDALREKAKYVFANPEFIKYNDLYPQHISSFALEGFSRSGTLIYKNQKYGSLIDKRII